MSVSEQEINILVLAQPRNLEQDVVRVLTNKVHQKERPSYMETVKHTEKSDGWSYVVNIITAPDAYITV